MLKNSKIALGTVQFGKNYGISNTGGKTDPLEVEKIFNTAHNNGIRVIDTAQAYGDSEKIIGILHGERFKIITKINPEITSFKSAEDLVQTSLENLNLKKLDGLLFHNASCALMNPNLVAELRCLQKQGIVQKLGYSVYRPCELQKLILKYGKPDIIQIPYSHLDRRFEKLVIKLHMEGVEVHSRSTFLQGLYFLDPKGLPEFFEPINRYLSEVRKKFPNHEQLAQALLGYCLSKDFIDYVVIGVNNQTQLIDNLSSFNAFHENLPIRPISVPEKIVLPYLWPK